MELSQKIISGVKWNGLSQAMRLCAQTVTSIILARLLAPEDFGLLGMALVFTGLIAIFNDMGMGSAIVQKQNLNQNNITSIFWFNIMIGIIAMVITVAVSPLIAIFYGQISLIPIISVMSLSFLLISLSMVQNSLLIKNFKFKKLAFLELISIILSSSFGISLAYFGYGVWSLVWQNISMNLIFTLFVWVFEEWKPKLYFSWEDIKSLKSFSGNLLGSNLLNYFSRRSDYLLIGKFLGASSLGYYTLAYTLMLFPLQNVSSSLVKTLFPALSKIQDNDIEFKNIYLKSTKYIAFITFPLMFGLFAVADEFILTIFGEKWAPAIFLIKVLSFVGLVQSIETTVGVIYLSKGKTDWMFQWNIYASIVAVGAIFFGMQWGINGVAFSYAIANIFLLTYLNFAIPFKLIGLKVTNFVLNLKREIATSLIMFSIVMIVIYIQRFYLLPGRIILSTCTIVGFISYLTATKIYNNFTYNEIKSHILSGIRKGSKCV